jgi:hypothetical protein
VLSLILNYICEKKYNHLIYSLAVIVRASNSASVKESVTVFPLIALKSITPLNSLKQYPYELNRVEWLSANTESLEPRNTLLFVTFLSNSSARYFVNTTCLRA